MAASFRLSEVLRKEDQHWPTTFQYRLLPPVDTQYLQDNCAFTERTIHHHSLRDGQSGYPLLSADVDGDGRDELIYYYYDALKGMILRTKSFHDNGWTYHQWILGDKASPMPLMAGDVDGDGREELLYYFYHPKLGLAVRLKSLSSAGMWASVGQVLGHGANPVPLQTVDFTGDGRADVVYADFTSQNELKLSVISPQKVGPWNKSTFSMPDSRPGDEFVVTDVALGHKAEMLFLDRTNPMALAVTSVSANNQGTVSKQVSLLGDATDRIAGNGGDDQIWGQNGSDELFGYSGNDLLYGGSNDDQLRGGHGSDRLFGESGNDGLFGGIEDGVVDELNGGLGADRYLGPRVLSVDEEDSMIVLLNTGETTNPVHGFGEPGFGPGSWTDERVEAIDAALKNLAGRFGSTTLLKHQGHNMTLQAIGPAVVGGGNLLGWNDGTTNTIAFTEYCFDSGMEWVLRTVYHEFAHNWDSPEENPFIPAFRRISHWDQTMDPGDTPSGSRDGWYYHDFDEGFARDYGTWSPYEDYATTWEYYFMSMYHSSGDLRRIDAKVANVERLFALLS